VFLIYTLYVQIVGFNDKMYTNYFQLLLYTFIRHKNALRNRQETTFFYQISACSCQEEE
jgi:hypothetical protein